MRVALTVLVVFLFGLAGWAQNPVVGNNADTAIEKPSEVGGLLRAESRSELTTEFSSSKDVTLRATLEPLPRPAAFAINPVIAPVTPVRPTVTEKESARNKKIWYSLAAVNHGAAAFDAWATRSAIDRGAREVNPLLKPFANSNAMYGAVQVVPFGMDYLGRRMMRSSNSTVRRLWWLPQTASAIGSLTAGIHNMGVNRR